VTGRLHFRDSQGISAVSNFNRALLNSGVVRDFIRQRQATLQAHTKTSHLDHKQQYLKHLIEKKGI
jgi:hypothetical protein